MLQIKRIAIFALLIRHITILQRQAATIFFMLIFIAVQAIKVGHTHDAVSISSSTPSKAVIEKLSYSCAICDYDFAKNKDHYFSDVVIKGNSNILTHFTANIHTKPTSVGAATSDRGPPSSRV